MLRMNKRDAVKLFQLTIDGGAEVVKTRRKPRNEEAQHQAALFRERNLLEAKYPQLRFVFSTLNGLFIPPHLLARAQEAGLAKGILDVWGPIRRYDAEEGVGWSGIVIDVKKLKGGRPSPEQLEWAAHLVANGYRVYFPAGALEAWRILCCYLNISGEDHIARQLEHQVEIIAKLNE
jgi:hypothetical protein